MKFFMQTVLGVVVIAAFAIDTGLTSPASCPAGYGCFRHPSECGDINGTMCNLLVAWKANDASGIDFIMSGKNNGTDPRWIAIGFSTDTSMGDDDILLCRQKKDTSMVALEHWWGIKDPAEAILDETNDDPAMDGLTNVETAFQDGYISCVFTRAVSVAGNDHIYDLSETTTADMTPKYYFFLGDGPVVNDVPLQHDKDPLHTKAGVDYTVAGDVIFEAEGSSSESHSDSHEDDAAGHIIASMFLMVMMTCLAVFIK